MKNIFSTSYLSYLSLILLYFLYISLNEFMPVPQESHFFVSRIDRVDFKIDSSYQAYYLLQTPIYFFLKHVYSNPTLFILLSYFFDFSIYLLVFLLTYKLTNNYVVSLLTIFIFSPLSLIFLDTAFQINTNFFSSKNVSLTWGRIILSSRILFAICYLFSIYFFIRKKYLGFFLFFFFSFLCHPNNSLTISSIFLTYLFFSSVLKKKEIKLFIYTLSITILGILPGLYRMSKIQRPGDENNHEIWFSNSLRDEVDDFSTIWNILSNTVELLLFIFVFILLTYFYFKKKNDKVLKTLYFLICSTIFVFLSFFLLELFIIIFDTGFFLMNIIGPFSAGVKVLPQSYFLFLFAFAVILKDYIFPQKYIPLALILLLIFVNFFVYLSNFFNSNNNLYSQFKYIEGSYKIKNINSPYELLQLKNNISSIPNPSYPIIYKIDNLLLDKSEKNNNIFKIYKENRNIKKEIMNGLYRDFENYEILVDAIRQNIPKKSKIIIPPYFSSLRDTLVDYTIFFQEKHDGNLMFGSKKIFDIFYERMKMLKIDYKNIPTEGSRLNYSYMRKIFMNLNEYDFEAISKLYENFDYLITEEKHLLSFQILYSDENFKIYKIN